MKVSCADGCRRILLIAFKWTSFSDPLCKSLWNKLTTSWQNHNKMVSITFTLSKKELSFQSPTSSNDLVSMATSAWSSSSPGSSLLLTSCLSLRACLSSEVINIYITSTNSSLRGTVQIFMNVPNYIEIYGKCCTTFYNPNFV